MNPINLSEVLSPSLILLDSDASSKKRVLEEISELCASPAEVELFYQFLINREKLGSTALGSGVAIPHCRIPFLHKAIGCFIRLKKGVDFDAPDNQAVNLIFGLFVPEAASEEHLTLLAQLATLFSQEAVRKELEAATSVQEIYHIFVQSS